MQLQTDVKLRGEASFEIIKPDGTTKQYLNKERTLKSGAIIKNTLLDGFFTKIIPQAGVQSKCVIKIGTSSAATDTAQTTLTAPYTPLAGELPSNNNPTINSTININEVLFTAEYEFLYGGDQLNGNFSEIGLDCFVAHYGNLVSLNNKDIDTRLLIKDDQGNPTTITVLPGEQLKVNYTLSVAIPTDPVVQSMTYDKDGTPTNISIETIRTGEGDFFSTLARFFASSSQTAAKEFYLTDQDVGGTDIHPTITQSAPQKISGLYDVVFSSTSNSRTLSVTVPPSKGNYNDGILGFKPYAGYSSYGLLYKWRFTPAIPKTDQQRLTFDIVTTFTRA